MLSYNKRLLAPKSLIFCSNAQLELRPQPLDTLILRNYMSIRNNFGLRETKPVSHSWFKINNFSTLNLLANLAQNTIVWVNIKDRFVRAAFFINFSNFSS
jgi:hypothetical protein